MPDRTTPAQAPEGSQAGPPQAGPPQEGPPFVASCRNCTRWTEGNCALGRVLAPGRLLCGDYEITPAFRDQLVSVMMKDILTQVQETTQRVQKLRAAQRLWN